MMDSRNWDRLEMIANIAKGKLPAPDNLTAIEEILVAQTKGYPLASKKIAHLHQCQNWIAGITNTNEDYAIIGQRNGNLLHERMLNDPPFKKPRTIEFEGGINVIVNADDMTREIVLYSIGFELRQHMFKEFKEQVEVLVSAISDLGKDAPEGLLELADKLMEGITGEEK